MCVGLSGSVRILSVCACQQFWEFRFHSILKQKINGDRITREKCDRGKTANKMDNEKKTKNLPWNGSIRPTNLSKHEH